MDAGSSCLHLSQSKTLPLSKVVSLKYFELFHKSSATSISKSYSLIREIALDAPHFAIKEPLNSKAAQLQCHSSTSYPLDLDFIPFHKLEMEINKIQYSLQLGSTTILEFSCLAPGVRFMGYNFILCAIPFLLRTYKDSKDALKYGRTTAPLLTQFNTFVA